MYWNRRAAGTGRSAGATFDGRETRDLEDMDTKVGGFARGAAYAKLQW
jgi:hypothetical protein